MQENGERQKKAEGMWWMEQKREKGRTDKQTDPSESSPLLSDENPDLDVNRKALRNLLSIRFPPRSRDHRMLMSAPTDGHRLLPFPVGMHLLHVSDRSAAA